MNQHDDKVRADVMRLVPLLTREGRRIVEAVAQAQDLHPTDVQALAHAMLVEANGTGLTAGELGGELGLTSGATTFLINRLVRAGLMERARDGQDGRKVVLHLSPAARDLAATIYPPVAALSDTVMNGFTPAELLIVRRFLAATATAMMRYRATLGDDGPPAGASMMPDELLP